MTDVAILADRLTSNAGLLFQALEENTGLCVKDVAWLLDLTLADLLDALIELRREGLA